MFTGINMHSFSFKDRPDASLYCCTFLINHRISCGLSHCSGLRLSSAKNTGLNGVYIIGEFAIR